MMDTGEDAYIDMLLGEIGSDEITPNDLRRAFLAGASQERGQMRADYNNELQEMSERFRAVNLVECAKLYDKDVQRELSAAKTEIARLKEARDAIAQQRNELTHDIDWEILRADEAKAEIARLQSDLSDLEEVHETLRAETKRADYWKAEAEKARAALKPDTGEGA